jgi:hypothetical protein
MFENLIVAQPTKISAERVIVIDVTRSNLLVDARSNFTRVARAK